MMVDIRFTDIHRVEDGSRKGIMVDVVARADGNGLIDKEKLRDFAARCSS